MHVPFQDQKTISTIISLTKDIKPDQIIFAGDLLDMYSLSRFDKSADRAEDLQYEIDSCVQLLRSFRKANLTSSMILIKGNHEARFEKFLNSSAKQLRNLKALTLENLLHFHKLGIRYEPYAYTITRKPTPLIVKHGEKCGMFPSKGELNGELTSGISGHAHKTSVAHRSGYDNIRLVWKSLGHLADKSQTDRHYSEALRWNQSFAVVRVSKKYWDIEVVEVQEKGFYCKLNGEWYDKK